MKKEIRTLVTTNAKWNVFSKLVEVAMRMEMSVVEENKEGIVYSGSGSKTPSLFVEHIRVKGVKDLHLEYLIEDLLNPRMEVHWVPS